jgi:hypothetical protein
MSEEHEHPVKVRYIVTFVDRSWWGGHKTLTLIGTGSSKKDNELLIFREGGGFYSINYERVQFMAAYPLEGHVH